MKKLLIFDLDGTLLNTLFDLKNAVNHALNLKKWPERSLEQIRQAIGNGVAKLVERSVPAHTPKEEYEETLVEFKKFYGTHYKDETLPYRGIVETVNKLHHDGYLLAVCTNKTQKVAEELVNNMFPGDFDYIQGDQTGIPKKPEPDMIDLILKHFDLAKQEVMYIGDTEVDRQTAVNSNLDYLIVTYGFRTIEELKKVCPDSEKIASPEALYERLKK